MAPKCKYVAAKAAKTFKYFISQRHLPAAVATEPEQQPEDKEQLTAAVTKSSTTKADSTDARVHISVYNMHIPTHIYISQSNGNRFKLASE